MKKPLNRGSVKWKKKHRWPNGKHLHGDCPHCGTRHDPGTIRCTDCGRYMVRDFYPAA